MAGRLKVVVWAGVAATFIGFFLPWATLALKTTEAERHIASSARRSLSKAFTSVKRGTKPAVRKPSRGLPVIPTRVSGHQIPQLAHRENVKVILGLTELVTKKRERIGRNSYAVYLVPGLALLCGLLLTSRVGATRPVAAMVALVCGVVAVAGGWMLLTTDTRVRYAVVIGPGLWLSLAAYAVLMLAAAAQVWPNRSSGARRLLPG